MDKDSICDIYAAGKKVGEFLWKEKKKHRNLFGLAGVVVKIRKSGSVVSRTNLHKEEDV